jgi:formylglycine-generating enzyme required for sulfatase activity
MVVLPAGSFVMGDARGPTTARSPVAVTLSRPFAMARTETTWDQWAACVADGGCVGGQDDHGWGKGSRPVVNVTWDQARDYAAWLSAKTGARYRLPTEAEWEYAARAGTTSDWWFGDTMAAGKVNCRHCDGAAPWDAKGSAPVGSYPPNPWGLSDMHGNVWEWTLDCWSPNHGGAAADGAARGPETCRDKTMRGGAWYYIAAQSVSAGRARGDRGVWSYVVGFRVVREPPFPTPPTKGPAGPE